MLMTILLFIKFYIFTGLINIGPTRPYVVIFSSLLSVFILALINRKKERKVISLGFYIFLSFILLADAFYFQHFNMLPNIRMLRQAGQLGAVGDSIREILNIRLALLVLDIPILIYLATGKKRENIFTWTSRKVRPISSGLVLLSFTIFLLTTNQLEAVKNQEIYTYHIVDIKNTFFTAGNNRDLTEYEIEDLIDRASLKEGKYTGLGKGKNLIVIQVEALQDFVIDLFYEGQEVTPYLNSLIKEGGSLYYDNYFQLLGRGNTSDSEFVTNNSIHPSMDEPTYNQYENWNFYGLPWLLRDNGYTAWAFHGYEKSFWNRERAYPYQGFQRFLSEEDYDFEDIIGFGIKDEDFYLQTLDYLQELDSVDDNPFYAFVVSLTSHTPFKMPADYEFLNIREEHKNNMIGDYLQSIHYADRELGRFIEGLKEIGLYDNSVIAIYGDHFGISTSQKEAGLMRDIIGVDYDFDHMMNIPLIIHISDLEDNEKISKVGSKIDFYPTIMNIMGYENNKGILMGRDLNNFEGYNLVATQTYMLKGSFIDEDTLFEISRDGVFNNSRAINRHTREEVVLEEVVDRYNLAIDEIEMSDYILRNNLIKELR